tara:strand:+ start:31 stop:399 length:369 start_codon:yes stop_codon:yes gene_type:complete
MKKLFILFFIFISSCNSKEELAITDENNLFSKTKETAIFVCGGKSKLIESKKSKLIESKNEEIIKIEIKDSSNTEKVKFFQFTIVETDQKGGKYKIINCYPNKDPKKSIIKTIKTNYRLDKF